jgi:type I restriction enzyme, R subunit
MKYKVGTNTEATESELPALVLLHEGLGYDYLTNSEINQIRKKDTESILYERLKKQLPELNTWMKKHPEAIDLVIEKIREENFAHNRNHPDTNEIIHAMYTELSMDNLKPLEIPFDLGHGEENQTIHLFNFSEPEKNDFLVTNQFILKKHKGSIIPDITIFVNGFPLVIIECKSPNISDPIACAIEDNLKKYQTSDNGADRLFFYNLFLIATCGDYAKHGCIEADSNFYAKWSSTHLFTDKEIENLAQRKPREQEKLIAGMLNKKTLINLLESYVIFDKVDGQNIKKMAKHQQLRAVSKAIDKLKISIKDSSNLGGTIWHSQGSGKSLTMFWLSKQIRKTFGDTPIIVVTDRTSLDDQIHINFQGAGWNKPIRVKDADELVDELQSPDKKVIMSTIQKLGLKKNPEILTEQTVIVLTDESHRTEFGETATRMRSALPNAIFFAFTATPIDKGNKVVFDKFGKEIDSYSWAESREDGVTVGIEYVPRWVKIEVSEAQLLSLEFEKEFKQFSKEERAAMKRNEIKMNNLRSAIKRIESNAKLIVKDFNERVGVEGFKAMIVASNREAATRYKKALDNIPDAPKSMIIMTSDLDEVGIDGDSWDKYYFSKKDREIKSKEFAKADDEHKILIVSDMLLTGYDAPIIQTMYLDHKLKEHTLLQAIARVNRKYKTKQYGTIIDYVNVAEELEEAKSMFKVQQSRDITFDKGALVGILKNFHSTVMKDVEGIDPQDRDSVLERFRAEDKRDIFYTHYKRFEKALDAVMPEPEANPYLDDFAILTVTIKHIRNYLNKGKFSTKPYSNKIQKLIDKYIITGKVHAPIESIDFDDEQFGIEIKKIKKKRAQNAALTGRIEDIIKMRGPDNPAFYKTIEKKLNALLLIKDEEENKAESIFKRLDELHEEAKNEEKRRKELGLSNGFEFAVFGELQKVNNDETICVKASIEIFNKIHPLTEYVDWDENLLVKKDIEKFIDQILDSDFPEDKIEKLTENIITLAVKHYT